APGHPRAAKPAPGRHRYTRGEPAAAREPTAILDVSNKSIEVDALVIRGERETVVVHIAVIPPSTANAAPVTKLAASEARNTAAAAISLGLPKRPIGYFASRLALISGSTSVPRIDRPIRVSATVPGQMPLAPMPYRELAAA